MFASELVLKALGGAVTGYITNSVALNMLFKKYGPFGGIVLRTRKEFIANTASLIERDIINHHTIEDELHSEVFYDVFKNILNDALGKYIPGEMGNLKWREVISSSATEKFLQQGGEERLFEQLFENLKFEDVLSEEQLEYLLTELLEIICQVLEEGDLGDRFLQELYTAYLEEDIFVGDSPLLEKLEWLLKEKREEYGELVSGEGLEELLSSLMEGAARALRDDISAASLEELLGEAYESLRSSTEPLVRADGRVEEIISGFLPSFFSLVIRWLRKNRRELEELVEQTIARTLEQGSGWKNGFLSFVYDKFFAGDATGRTGLVDTVIDYLEEVNSGENYGDFSSALCEYLEGWNFGRLIREMEVRGLISREMVSSRGGDILEQIPGTISEGGIIREIVSRFNTEDLLYSLAAVVPLLEKLKVKTVLEEGDIPSGADIAQFLREYKSRLVFPAASAIHEGMGGEKISAFFSPGNYDLSFLAEKVAGPVSDFRDREIKRDYDRFVDPEQFTAEQGNKILAFITGNLPSILKGKIRDTVSGSLLKLSEEEIRSTLENFMGRELKPITYFGALLGLFAGAFLHTGVETASLSLPVLLNLLMVFGVYGFVGYLTNVIALKMIFQPYAEKRIFGLRLPFTPGVVARNKDRFSTTMGGFVEEELLNSNAVSELLEGREEEITGKLLALLTADDFRMFREQLVDRDKELAAKITEHFFTLLEQEREAVAAGLISLIKDVSPASIDFSKGLDLREDLNPTGYLADFEIKTFLRDFRIQLTPAFLRRLYFSLKEYGGHSLRSLLPASRVEELREEIVAFLQRQALAPETKAFVFSRLEEMAAEFAVERLPVVLQDNLDRILDVLYAKGLEELEHRQDEIAALIMDFIEKDYGFLRKKVFEFLAEDELVAFLEEFFAGTLPSFLEKKRPAVKEIMLEFSRDLDSEVLAEFFSEKREVLERLWEELAGGELFGEFAGTLVDRFFDLEIGDLFAQISSENSEEIIVSSVGEFPASLLEDLAADLSLEELLESLNIKPAKNFWEDKEEEYLSGLLADLAGVLEDIELGNILDMEMLKKDLVYLLERIAGEHEIRQGFAEFVTGKIREVIDELDNYFNDGGPEKLIAIILKGILRSLRNNLGELFAAVDFRGVTEREIQQMNPREIEELFSSFAGRYLVRLKRYGWLGGGIGILTEMISLLM